MSSQGFAVRRQATVLSTCGQSQVAQSPATQVPVRASLRCRLLGRLVVWSCAFSRSCRSLLPLPGFCFNLSVAEMQSTQRAYFYQRFPILHLEPGDWPPGVAALVCGASRAVASASAASSCPLALLPDCPALVRPALWEGSPHRRPLVENQPNQETSRYRS